MPRVKIPRPALPVDQGGWNSWSRHLMLRMRDLGFGYTLDSRTEPVNLPEDLENDCDRNYDDDCYRASLMIKENLGYGSPLYVLYCETMGELHPRAMWEALWEEFMLVEDNGRSSERLLIDSPGPSMLADRGYLLKRSRKEENPEANRLDLAKPGAGFSPTGLRVSMSVAPTHPGEGSAPSSTSPSEGCNPTGHSTDVVAPALSQANNTLIPEFSRADFSSHSVLSVGDDGDYGDVPLLGTPATNGIVDGYCDPRVIRTTAGTALFLLHLPNGDVCPRPLPVPDTLCDAERPSKVQKHTRLCAPSVLSPSGDSPPRGVTGSPPPAAGRTPILGDGANFSPDRNPGSHLSLLFANQFDRSTWDRTFDTDGAAGGFPLCEFRSTTLDAALGRQLDELDVFPSSLFASDPTFPQLDTFVVCERRRPRRLGPIFLTRCHHGRQMSRYTQLSEAEYRSALPMLNRHKLVADDIYLVAADNTVRPFLHSRVFSGMLLESARRWKSHFALAKGDPRCRDEVAYAQFLLVHAMRAAGVYFGTINSLLGSRGFAPLGPESHECVFDQANIMLQISIDESINTAAAFAAMLWTYETRCETYSTPECVSRWIADVTRTLRLAHPSTDLITTWDTSLPQNPHLEQCECGMRMRRRLARPTGYIDISDDSSDDGSRHVTCAEGPSPGLVHDVLLEEEQVELKPLWKSSLEALKVSSTNGLRDAHRYSNTEVLEHLLYLETAHLARRIFEQCGFRRALKSLYFRREDAGPDTFLILNLDDIVVLADPRHEAQVVRELLYDRSPQHAVADSLATPLGTLLFGRFRAMFGMG
jgi:hypothetical protein